MESVLLFLLFLVSILISISSLDDAFAASSLTPRKITTVREPRQTVPPHRHPLRRCPGSKLSTRPSFV